MNYYIELKQRQNLESIDHEYASFLLFMYTIY